VNEELIVRGRERLNKKKKGTKATQTNQAYQPSKSIKKKGCDCGKKTTK
jgi:hypothetical protein